MSSLMDDIRIKQFRERESQCRVCGVECDQWPADGSGAICPIHCDDHEYEHDTGGAGWGCKHCGDPPHDDWFSDWSYEP